MGKRFAGWNTTSTTTTSKYKNKITEYKGEKYHSKKEAHYAQGLDLKILAGEVLSWSRQVKFKITVNEIEITNYICDFVVTKKNGDVFHVDVKGANKGLPYEMFKIKKRLLKATYGLEIIEV